MEKREINDELSYEDIVDLADDILVVVNDYTGNIDLLKYDTLRHKIAGMLKGFIKLSIKYHEIQSRRLS